MTKAHGYVTQRRRFEISKPCACLCLLHCQAALVVTNPPAKAEDVRDAGLIPRWRRSPGEGHGNPLQYSCLENPDGQRSLASYSPQGFRERDTSEATYYTWTWEAPYAWFLSPDCFVSSQPANLINMVFGITFRVFIFLPFTLPSIECKPLWYLIWPFYSVDSHKNILPNVSVVLFFCSRLCDELYIDWL